MNTKQHYLSALRGKTIINVRSFSPVEMEDSAWVYEDPQMTAVIEFSDNSYAIVLMDPEGNGPGFLEVGSYGDK